MSYCTHKLEFSIDPLSDATPAWTDISAYLIEADWFSGKARDLDEPQAGGATFRLKNTNRRFEPEYAAGAYYPNIVPMRRFRWSITADTVSYPQGIYYAQNWQVQYPDPSSTYSEVTVTCVDGFGVLQQQALPGLPSNVSSYSDVIAAENPFAYYPLADPQGRAMTAVSGPEGVYRGLVYLDQQPNPVLGDEEGSLILVAGVNPSMARAKMDDEDVFQDANAVSIECVVNNTTGGPITSGLAAGPQNATAPTISLNASNAQAVIGTSTLISTGGSNLAVGRHHVACTFDGTTLTHWVDGAVHATIAITDNLAGANAGEFLYIGATGGAGPSGGDLPISHVAFYNYPLTAAQIAAHTTAALSRGYDPAKTGTRIAALATNALWSVAGITGGQVINVQARMQTGQPILDEIIATVKAETPYGLFYFDDSGNPAYQGIDYVTTLDATLGELEVQYDSLELVYDDEIWNESTVGNDQGISHTVDNTTSQGQYGVRTQDETSLIISGQLEANQLSQAIVDQFSTPMYRIASVSLNGAAQNRRVQILAREIGDVIRVKRRGEGGTANPDIHTRILGKQKHLDVARNLTCTWSLSRGFPAADAHWHLGDAGYTELGTNTVLA